MSPHDRDARRALHRRGRLIQETIRAQLLQWDPIGAVPDDEYDCMIGPLLGLLSKGATADEIATWISEHADEHLGLAPDQDSDSALARRLVAAWQDIATSPAE